MSPRPDVPQAAPRIVLAEPDPYLAFLIRLDLPQAQVTEAVSDDDLAEQLAGRPDVVIADLAGGRTAQAVASGAPVIGITDAVTSTKASVTSHVRRVLVRPVLPDELHRCVREAAGLAGEARTRRARELPFAAARVGTVALATLMTIDRPSGLVVSAAVAWVALRMLPSTRARTVWADAVVTGSLLAASGGLSSPFILLALVVAVQAGVALGTRDGALAGAIITAGTLFALSDRLGIEPPAQVAFSLCLLPLVGFTSALAARLHRSS